MADLPRKILTISARRNVAKYDGKARVYFKYTCDHCQTRCAFCHPNTLFGKGQCYKCGKTTEVTKGGYLMLIKQQEPHYTVEESPDLCETTSAENIYEKCS